MKKDIVLCGVGGQGILSIATIIAEAATLSGVYLKQAEVHGMSQRGGDVESDLRLSNEEICSDLIPKGGADLIVSMEPMEALRQLAYLKKDGMVIASSSPFVNIPNYPDQEAMMRELQSLPHVKVRDVEKMSKENNVPRSGNMILLGMAAKEIEIVGVDALRESIKRIFEVKGRSVVEANAKAFEVGLSC